MKQADTGFLPVLEKFTRRLVGVVTDRDLCIGVIVEGKDPMHSAVREFMSTKLVCCDPQDDVRRALDLMRDKLVHRILVVDAQGHLEGVFSIGDLIRYTPIDAKDICSALEKINEPGSMSGMRRARTLRKVS